MGMVGVRSACGSQFQLDCISPQHTVKQLKSEIRDKLGMEEEYQLLSFRGRAITNDELVLKDLLVQPESLLSLNYSLDGGDAQCCMCFIMKVEGGGCGCCPVKRWGFCWEDWPADENDTEPGEYHL